MFVVYMQAAVLYVFVAAYVVPHMKNRSTVRLYYCDGKRPAYILRPLCDDYDDDDVSRREMPSCCYSGSYVG